MYRPELKENPDRKTFIERKYFFETLIYFMYLDRPLADNRKIILIGMWTFLSPAGRPASRRPARGAPILTLFSEPNPYETLQN